MTDKKERTLLRRIAGALLRLFLLFLVVLFGTVLYLMRDHEPYFRERHGELVDTIRLNQGEGIISNGIFTLETLRLVSSSGLEVEVAIKRPDGEDQVPHPVIVMIGGHDVGRDAVDVISDPRGVVIAAISYPYDGDREVEGWDLVPAIPSLRRALMDTPPALMLTLDYLLEQPYADPDRVELVGVSLGAPLACAAGAFDQRFKRVWSIHCGARPVSLIGQSLRERVPSVIARSMAARLAAFLVRPVAPERTVPRIAPRPFIQVNAEDDARISKESAEFLFEAAREPKELIWRSGDHAAAASPGPEGERVVNDLVDLVLDRVLAEPD